MADFDPFGSGLAVAEFNPFESGLAEPDFDPFSSGHAVEVKQPSAPAELPYPETDILGASLKPPVSENKGNLVTGLIAGAGGGVLRSAAGLADLLGKDYVSEALQPAIAESERFAGTGVSAKIGKGVGGAAELIPGGIIGAISQAGAQTFGETFKQTKDLGKSAASAIIAAPEMAAYWLIGGGAAKAVAPLIRQAGPLVKGAAGALTSSLANVATSSSLRAINERDINAAIPTPESVGADVLVFGLFHGIHSGMEAAKSTAEVKSRLSEAPTDLLEIAASDSQARAASPYDPRLWDAELARRGPKTVLAESATQSHPADVLMPETKAAVVEKIQQPTPPAQAEAPAQGPVTAYHGTDADGDIHPMVDKRRGADRQMHFFTTDPESAKGYGSNVHKVELDIKNPFDYRDPAAVERVLENPELDAQLEESKVPDKSKFEEQLRSGDWHAMSNIRGLLGKMGYDSHYEHEVKSTKAEPGVNIVVYDAKQIKPAPAEPLATPVPAGEAGKEPAAPAPVDETQRGSVAPAAAEAVTAEPVTPSPAQVEPAKQAEPAAVERKAMADEKAPAPGGLHTPESIAAASARVQELADQIGSEGGDAVRAQTEGQRSVDWFVRKDRPIVWTDVEQAARSRGFSKGKVESIQEPVGESGRTRQDTIASEAPSPLANAVESDTHDKLKQAIEKVITGNTADADRAAIKAVMEGGSKVLPGRLQKKLQSVLKEIGLSREDLNAIGITPFGTSRTIALLDRGAAMVRDLSDVIGGKAIPKLTESGVMDEAVQHAAARQYVPALVEELLSKVFPEKYQDADAMARSVDIIKKDNILGGYDSARQELEALKQAEKPSETQIEAQQQFVNNIESAHDLAQLDADVRASKGTDIESDVHRWEEHVSSLMDSLYNELKLADPNAARETRGRHYAARMNLLPLSEVEKLAAFAEQDKPLPDIAVSNFRNPNVKRDKFMRQARLTGEYSNDANAVLLNSFGGRWYEVTKLRLYNALEKAGVGMILEPGSSGVSEIGYEPAVKLPIKYPETNPETGRTRMVEKSLYVQKKLVPEIRNVLNTDQRLTPNPIFKAITQLQLLQLADASAHTKNIHTVVVNSLGSTSMGRDLIRKIPGIGSADAVREISTVARQIAADSPGIRAEVAGLAKRGMVRPSYPSTGIQRFTRMQELIHSVDTASRVIMNRRFTELVKRGIAKDTIENRRNFVQQIGEYNRRLMNRNEASLRDWGLSPFIVAGRTFNRFSRRLITADPGFKTDSGKAELAARAAQVSGLVFAATIPAFINMFTTGSMGGRAGTPVGAIDFGPSFDTDDGKRRGIDVFQLTGIRRGLRGTGLEAAIEGFRAGNSLDEISGDAMEGIITTSAHPYIGPGIGGIFQTITGKRIDLRSGRVTVSQARPMGEKGKLSGKQVIENARVALKSQNPFIYGIGQKPIHAVMEGVFGIKPDPKDDLQQQQIWSGLVKSPLSAIGYKETKPPKPAKAEPDKVTHL